MPNGRRGFDWAKDFSKVLIKAIKKSKKYKLEKVLGATTCWEGEERLIISTEVEVNRSKSRQKIFIWISDREEWKK